MRTQLKKWRSMSNKELNKELSELRMWYAKNRYLSEKPKQIVGRLGEVRKNVARIMMILEERRT